MLSLILINILNFFKTLFYITWSLFIIWIIICSFDINPPIYDLDVSVSDSAPGKQVDILSTFVRTRQCSIISNTNITDSKGQIVFTKTVERPVNGNIGPVEQLDHYTIDDDANSGKASFDMFIEWECPYNIVHKIIKPIKLKYQKTFEIKEK